jgi:hypothetical protein
MILITTGESNFFQEKIMSSVSSIKKGMYLQGTLRYFLGPAGSHWRRSWTDDHRYVSSMGKTPQKFFLSCLTIDCRTWKRCGLGRPEFGS